MIKLKDCKIKIKDKEIINIYNLKISRGDKVGLIGPNGAGKTTLGELIIGLNKKYSGEFLLEDKTISKNAVFQDSGYSPFIPLNKLFKVFMEMFKVNKDINEYFNKFNMQDFLKRKYSSLSGGEKQKFKLMVAIVNNPDLLLLDEITTSLDYVWANKIINIINELFNEKDKTLLLVSHHPEEVAKLCNRIIKLSKGKIEKDLDISQLELKDRIDLLRKEMNYESIA